MGLIGCYASVVPSNPRLITGSAIALHQGRMGLSGCYASLVGENASLFGESASLSGCYASLLGSNFRLLGSNAVTLSNCFKLSPSVSVSF